MEMAQRQLTCSHEAARDKHEHSYLSLRPTEENEYNARAGQDGKSKGKIADANLSSVMSIRIVRLSGPEENDGEEVGAGDEGNDESQQEDPGFSGNGPWKHGEFGKLPLVDDKGEEKEDTNNKRSQYVGGAPTVLVTAPLYGGHEEQEPTDGEDSADVINSPGDFPPRESYRDGSRGREVKDEGQDKADKGPHAADDADVAPRSVKGNVLGPKNAGAEGEDGEDEDGNVESSLAGGCQFGSDGEGRKLAEAGSSSVQGHAGDDDIHVMCRSRHNVTDDE